MKSSGRSCCGTGKPLNKKRAATSDIGFEAIERLGGEEVLSRAVPGEDELAAMSRRYHALSDPLRLTILFLLRDQPLCVCVINRFMHISDSKLSYHLTVLKESGLIEGECRGNWIFYSITDHGNKALKYTERMGK
ncbi:ArsR/SmtB family transcription factor [Methanoregula sp.]|jgi:ArsR family transcriptional regulator|uniref:ArsR/SmtB family transcription factor n=1 Tax=Methanoregula sp. TaxID=2052170 RepID=UPI0035641AB5